MAWKRYARAVTTTLVAGMLLNLQGCASFGPPSIQAGRLTYADAINQTDMQQTLLIIVRNRYEEATALLGVSGVAASISVSGSATVNLPLGNPIYYTGSMIPFSSTLTLEESPTISYSPVQGKQYLAQLMLPIPLEVLVPLTRGAPDPAPLLTLLVNRINDLPNPVFLPPSMAQPDERFLRAVELIGQLRAVGRLTWASTPGKEEGTTGTFLIVLRQYAPVYTPQVRELLKLLGAPALVDETKPLILPVVFTVEAPASGGISVETRSVYELLLILSAAMDVPGEHLKSGVAQESPPLGWAGRAIRIRWSASQPENASVAVKYRDAWYYIDDSDYRTKRAFRFVHALVSMVVGEAIKGGAGAPVLTVPVR